MSRSIVWFRRELRLEDNAALVAAAKESTALLCVYVVPPRFFDMDPLGFPRVGPYRRRFLAESLDDLRTALAARGQRLLVRLGSPEVVLPALAASFHCDRVFAYRLPGTEEAAEERAVEQRLSVEWSWGHTLVAPEALPMSVAALPRVFTEFRKRLEARLVVEAPLPVPPLPPAVAPEEPEGDVSALLAVAPIVDDPRAVFRFRGGARAGKDRLRHYLWESDAIARYRETRNGMHRANDSSKLSPWLADGALSPRHVYEQLRQYEAERTKNESTYWLFFELLWRDFFQWVLLQHGKRLFRRGGILDKKVSWDDDDARFRAWCEGRTGVPFVDAQQRELAATGWMSNRGRQNAAAFLAKSMRVPWTWGARWFESLLLDFDVGSNWGNWNYTAGVGNDPRPNRWFNPVYQGEQYDPDGAFVRTWVPELDAVPGGAVHAFFRRSREERRSLAPQYPDPCEGAFER